MNISEIQDGFFLAKKRFQIDIHLNIPKDELMKWYRQEAKWVTTRAIDGRSVRFPAEVLRPFVGYDGVQGRFTIDFTEEGKFIQIQRH